APSPTAPAPSPAHRSPEPARASGVARPSGPVPVISPLVRKLARDHGIDLRELTGSGPDGLILRADVERATAADRGPAPAAPAPASAPAPATA
ncbi:2-oxo acid dehydrogenase subunit E2, partial [Streptomyces sp. SID5785]|uniref:E3 binding domain-containing protein n=1 Tax=Streptomyces sp. SID5785 TaxID=2690309 RepID=UPI0013613123